MEKKSNKGLIISLIIIIPICCILGFIGGDIFYNKEHKEVKTETKTEAKKEEYNDKDEINLNNLEFNIDKCQNCESDMNYYISQYGDFASISLDKDKKSVSLFLNYNELSEFDPKINKNNNAQQEITFDQTVEDIVYAGFGQDATYETILYLLNDGTVEYTPLLKAAEDNNIKSYGKLGNLKDIVKFYKVTASPDSDFGSGQSYLAQSKDGSLYDLYPIIQSTNNY